MASTYSEFLEALAEAAIIVNRAGDIAVANRQAEALFGYGRGELVGQSVQLLVPEAARGHAEQIAEYFAHPRGRGPGHGLDLSGRRRDGIEFPADILLGPITEGDETFAIAIIRPPEPSSQPALFSQPLVSRTVTLPADLVEGLTTLGDGNLSAGIRRMAEMGSRPK